MLPLFIFIFVLFDHNSAFNLKNKSFHPDTGLNISQLLQRHGYPFEKHEVQTVDGYKLEIHRIPHGLNNAYLGTERPVAFLVHGLLSQSIDYLNNDQEKSLGLMLADRGYDVWLMNHRGNTYSRKHVTLDPDSKNKKLKKKFWDFSFNELGTKDLPATFDYILNKTGQEKLYYIGHSQGTTSLFVLLSELPEYNEKIKLATVLAPAAFMFHNVNPLMNLSARHLFEAQILSDVLEMYEMMPHYDFILKIVKAFCYKDSEYAELCQLFYYAFSFAYAPEEFNMTLLPVHLSNSPSGGSFKEGFHYLQGIKLDKFRKYDYGPIKNLKVYGKMSPPEYNLTNIKAPVSFHYATGDIATNYKDVEYLATKLPNIVRMNKVHSKSFGHIDFIWGNNVVPYVYNVVLEDLNKY